MPSPFLNWRRPKNESPARHRASRRRCRSVHTRRAWRPVAGLALALGLLILFARAEATAAELFNGRDFTGWTFYMRSNAAPARTWSIRDGVIHCAGKPPGYLRTEKSYHDYHLTVEWRFVKVAPHANNTGILIHMQPPDAVWPRCIECQGQSGKQGDFWLQSGATAEGHPANGRKAVHVPMTAAPNEKPVGEWNTYEVVAHGNTVETMVNGRAMNRITGCNVAAGCIGFQSEGAEIEIRRVRLEPWSDPSRTK